MKPVPPDFHASPGCLSQRTILLTGAAGGIGRELAKACGARGAQLVLAGPKVAPLEQLYDELIAQGASMPAILPIDLAGASPQDYAAMADHLEREFGGLDAIVHLAAVFAGLTPLQQTEPEKWLTTLHVNLTAPFLLNRALLPLLRQSKFARVVFSLEDERRVAQAHWGSYGVSKLALNGLMAITHQELESQGIGVLGVVPSATRTALRAKAYLEDSESQPPAAAVPAYLYALTEAAPGTTIGLTRDRPLNPAASGESC